MTKATIAFIILSLIGFLGPRQPARFYLQYCIGLGLVILVLNVILGVSMGATPKAVFLLQSNWAYGYFLVLLNYCFIGFGIIGLLRVVLRR